MQLVDSHCHLNFPDFVNRIPDILQNATDNQIAHLLCIATTWENRHDVLSLAKGTHNAREAGGVMHCFAENWDVAKQALDIGFYISFSGIVTFKSAKEVQEAARQVPLNRLLVETDAPYLAPTPYRGKTNEPAYVRHTAEYVAQLRGISLEELAEATTANFFTLFSGAQEQRSDVFTAK